MKTFTKRTLISLCALVVFGILAAGSADSGSTGGSSNPSSQAPTVKETLLHDVKLDFTWGKEGFDNIMIANFKINNATDHGFKDFEITCEHYATSGTMIDRNTRTIYEVVKAHSKKSIPHFSMGFIHSQAKSSNCRITDLVPLD